MSATTPNPHVGNSQQRGRGRTRRPRHPKGTPRDFTAAPSATQILTSAGRVEQVPKLLRPYVQAALIASAEGGPDSKPLRAWGSAPIRYSLLKPSSCFLDLATIASLIKVEPLSHLKLRQDDLPAGYPQHQPAAEPESLSLTQAQIFGGHCSQTCTRGKNSAR